MAKNRGGRPRAKPLGVFGIRLRRALERAIEGQIVESRADFARKVGIDGAQLARYEDGRVVPKMSYVEDFAKALRCSLGELVGDDSFTVTADDDTAPSVEEFLRSPDGARVTPSQAARLRRMRLGKGVATVPMLRGIWLEMAAQDARGAPSLVPAIPADKARLKKKR